MRNITSGQQKRLQTLYGKFAAHSIDISTVRAARLQWASEQLGRKVASFRDLTGYEASRLIDALQGALGITAENSGQRNTKRLDRAKAIAAGTAGRRGYQSSTVDLVSAADLARIEDALTRLGWTRARFDAWLRSPSSPLKRANPALRTVADANKVWWPLKQMLKRAGCWRADDEQKFIRNTKTEVA